eukprot:m.226783 g.226783  ORF g.226783 m.226783 type:complete len:1504 (+) comp13867_c0_seq2:65-4576(+)
MLCLVVLLSLLLATTSTVVLVWGQQQCLNSDEALARLGMFVLCEHISPSLCESRADVARACPQQCNLEFCTNDIPFEYTPPQAKEFQREALVNEDETIVCNNISMKGECDENPFCRWIYLRDGSTSCISREIPTGYNCLLSSLFDCAFLPECDVVGFQCLPKVTSEILSYYVPYIRTTYWALGLNQPYGAPTELSSFAKVLAGLPPEKYISPQERKVVIDQILLDNARLLQNLTHNGIESERSWVWDSPLNEYSAFFTTETFIHADEFLTQYLESDFSISFNFKPAPRSKTYLPEIGEDISGKHLQFQNRFFLPPLAPVINHDLQNSRAKLEEHNLIENNPYSAIGLSVGINGIVVYEMFLVDDPNDEDGNGVLTKPSIVSRLTLPLDLGEAWTFLALECEDNHLRLILNSSVQWDIPTHPKNKLRVVPYVGASYFGAYHGQAHQLLFTNDGKTPTIRHHTGQNFESFQAGDANKILVVNGTLDEASEFCNVCTSGIYKQFLKAAGASDDELSLYQTPVPYKESIGGRRFYEFAKSFPSFNIPSIHVTEGRPFAIGNFMDKAIADKWVHFSFSSDVDNEQPVFIDDENRFNSIIIGVIDTFQFQIRVTFNITDSITNRVEQLTHQYLLQIVVRPQLQLRVRPNKRLLLSSMLFSSHFPVTEHLGISGGLAPFKLRCATYQCSIRQNSEIATIANTHDDVKGPDRPDEIELISEILNTTYDHSFDNLHFVPLVGKHSQLYVDGVKYEGTPIVLHITVTDAIGNIAKATLIKWNTHPTTVVFPAVEVVKNEEFLHYLPHAHATNHLQEYFESEHSTTTKQPRSMHGHDNNMPNHNNNMHEVIYEAQWSALSTIPSGITLHNSSLSVNMEETGYYWLLLYTFTDSHQNAAFVANVSFNVVDPLRVATVANTSCSPISPSFDAVYELSGDGRLYSIDCGGGSSSIVCDIYFTVQSFGGDEVDDITITASNGVELTSDVIVTYPRYKCFLATAVFPTSAEESSIRSLVEIEYTSIKGEVFSQNITYLETNVAGSGTQQQSSSATGLAKDTQTGIIIAVIILVLIVVGIVAYRWTGDRSNRKDMFSEFGVDFSVMARPPEHGMASFTKMRLLPLVTATENVKVYKGIFKDRQTLFCTILELSVEKTTQTQRRRFYNAAVAMNAIRNHDNVTQLYGVVGRRDDMWMLVDSTAKTSLDNVLVNQSDIFTLPVDKRMSILSQVASGLEHIHSQGLAHRNICAKSILFDMKTGDCKVFGFHLAKYYKKNVSMAVEQTASLNYRWSALEVLRDNVFSFESDIWSFGVFMYEVFASSEPYSELGRDVDLVDFLLTGSRLPNPFNTDDKIHNCMLRCWMAAEERRPLLKNLIQCFTTLEEIARIEIAKNSLIGDAVLFSHFPVLDLLTPVEKDALRRTSASNVRVSNPVRSVISGVAGKSDLSRFKGNSHGDMNYWGEIYTVGEEDVIIDNSNNDMHREFGVGDRVESESVVEDGFSTSCNNNSDDGRSSKESSIV